MIVIQKLKLWQPQCLHTSQHQLDSVLIFLFASDAGLQKQLHLCRKKMYISSQEPFIIFSPAVTSHGCTLNSRNNPDLVVHCLMISPVWDAPLVLTWMQIKFMFCCFAAGFPTRPDETVAHAGPEQRDQAARHARLRGRLQQVGKDLLDLYQNCVFTQIFPL